MEWPDDEELQATLALLEAWDASPDAALAVATEPSRSRTVNKSRERRKQETAELRAEMRALQVELSAQRHRHARLLHPHTHGRGGRLVNNVLLWETIARRQAAARKKAEAENAELRRAVSRQVRFTRELLRVVERAQRDAGAAGTPFATGARPRDGGGGHVSKQDQMRRVEAIGQQWPDQFYLNRRFIGSATEFYEAKVVRCDASEVVHEVHALLPLAFTVQQVGEAVWTVCQLEHASSAEETYAQTHRVLKDWIVAQLMTTLRAGGLRGEIKGRFVTRRLDRGSEEAFAACAYSEPEGVHPHLTGVRVFEDSWVRLVDASDLGFSDLPTPLTLVQLVRHTQICLSTADEDATTSVNPAPMEPVLSFVGSYVQGDVEWMRHALEDALLLGNVA